jgi:hypothetical protein
MPHLALEQIRQGLPAILEAPKDAVILTLIVRRPAVDQREVVARATLDVIHGLVGDCWKARRSSRTADGSPHPDMQINITSARVMGLLAGDRERWALAGDQLFVDLDLSAANLPPGTRLSLGAAVLEVTAQPHTGCGKFVERFGVEAMKFVTSPEGRVLNLRGINARVVQGGEVTVGDQVLKVR